MRFALLFLTMLAANQVHAGEKAWQPISIRWHGQSFFTVVTSKGKVLAFDPHVIPEYGRNLGLKADIVCITHAHNDHNRIEVFENARDKDLKIFQGVKGVAKRSEWNELQEEIGGVSIRTVGTYHDDAKGMQYGKNAIFIVEVDGWKIAHLGDLGHLLSAEQVRQVGKIDVLMLPVGGIYTINGSDAKKVVDQLKPAEYIFPMHHATKVYEDLLAPTEFVETFPADQIANSDDNQVRLNRDPQRPRPLVVLLGFEPKKK